MNANGKPEERSFLEIDLYNLHLELAKQASLVEKWGVRHAKAKNATAEAKDEMEFVFADIGNMIRSNPKKFGLTKTTEETIKSAITVHQEYRAVQQKFRDAKHYADKLGVLMNALEHKKQSLEDTVKLHLAGYYAEPKLPRGTEDIRHRVSEEVKKVRKPLRRKGGE